jgi:hypothetical protein
MKKIGISSVYTGFNYGSSLQSYATKRILAEIGYKGINISLKGSLINGRDVRVKKILVIAFRLLNQIQTSSKRVKIYNNSIKKPFSEETKKLFMDFKTNYIQSCSYSWIYLRKMAHKSDFKAFICGSDQIWSGEALYVDPQYYLRYAPKNKRIAFAPSFGSDKVANYNKRIIKRYINEIPNISVREESGVSIIKELTNREAIHLIDPTLILDKEKWNTYLELDENDFNSKDYILAYFLSEPSEYAKAYMIRLAIKTNLKVIALPYLRNKSDWVDYVPDAGPIEFVNFVRNAKYVCTDSFHGTAFSIIYQVNFFTFDRQYGNAINQSTRVLSFLKLMSLTCRFNPLIENFDSPIDFKKCQKILEIERKKAISFLLKSINSVGGNDNE